MSNMELQQLQKETQRQGEEISCLKSDNAWIKQELSTAKSERNAIVKEIKIISEKLLGRPSWLITTVFAILMGMVGAMATYIFLG